MFSISNSQFRLTESAATVYFAKIKETVRNQSNGAINSASTVLYSRVAIVWCRCRRQIDGSKRIDILYRTEEDR
jgi:hypothetical protein